MNLLRAGADREAVDVNGYRPLHYSTMWSHPATTKTLLKAGAALESITRVDGTRPLHIAARYGSALVVRELLGQGEGREVLGDCEESCCQSIVALSGLLSAVLRLLPCYFIFSLPTLPRLSLTSIISCVSRLFLFLSSVNKMYHSL